MSVAPPAQPNQQTNTKPQSCPDVKYQRPRVWHTATAIKELSSLMDLNSRINKYHTSVVQF